MGDLLLIGYKRGMDLVNVQFMLMPTVRIVPNSTKTSIKIKKTLVC